MTKAMKLLLWLGLLLGGVAHAGTVHYYYTDPQGTVLAKTDAQGNITATYDYAPYGSQAMGVAPNGPGYTGHVNDPESGLVYMQARYYDPAVGRFINADPVGPSAGNAFNFNRFAYANNNPIVNMDPDGRVTGSLINPDGEGVAGSGFTTYVNAVKQAAVKYVANAASRAVKSMVDGVKDIVKENLQTHTYTGSVGGAGTVAVPLGVPFASPAVGLTASANVSLNSHGQVALNGSIGPVVGDGGGAAGGVAFGGGVVRGGAVPRGLQAVDITNHFEGDFGGVPGVPINIGLSADWNKGSFNASSGAARGSAGVIMFVGGGKQINLSYVINN